MSNCLSNLPGHPDMLLGARVRWPVYEDFREGAWTKQRPTGEFLTGTICSYSRESRGDGVFEDMFHVRGDGFDASGHRVTFCGNSSSFEVLT